MIYPGTSSLGGCAPEDSFDHTASIGQQILDGMALGSTWLIESFTRIYDGMDPMTNGLHSTCEYNAATMVASKHHRRSVVLNHCSDLAHADYK